MKSHVGSVMLVGLTMGGFGVSLCACGSSGSKGGFDGAAGTGGAFHDAAENPGFGGTGNAAGGTGKGGSPTGGAPVGGSPGTGGVAGTGGDKAFSFVVFGDMNGGACQRNDRVKRIIDRIARETDAAFFVQTGDLIDGYVDEDSNTTMCFARDPATVPGLSACPNGVVGNIAELLQPLKTRAPAQGLVTSYFQVVGNHDDNWGSGWYPDPCGDGICQFLAPLTPGQLFNHATGDICSLSEDRSAHSMDFYYSFAYQGSYFIVLSLDNDDDNMIASCNSHPGHPDCASYCSDPALEKDAERNDSCWGGVAQYDWLHHQLDAAAGQYRNIFVFAHAILLGSGDSHGPVTAADVFRKLLEAHDVSIFFNGHNHAYERTARVKGSAADPAGTMYLTVGPAGAPYDGVNGDWFTAADSSKWADWGEDDKMATYVKVQVDGSGVHGSVYSLGTGSTPVDQF
jgi:hypothetical protein